MTESNETKMTDDVKGGASPDNAPYGSPKKNEPETDASKPENNVVEKVDDSSLKNETDITDTQVKPERQTRESNKPEKPKAQQKKRSWATPILAFFFLLLMLSVAGLAYYGNTLLLEQKQTIAALENRVVDQLSAAKQGINSVDKKQVQNAANLQEKIAETRQQLSDMNQRVFAQGKRIRAMSDTSREDWLLAEAEYLLKLANQRVLIERNAGGAEALLEEADNILRDMADPDLHPLRRALAKDLAALRLMDKVDVEGIYLTMVALAEQVDSLPLQLVEQEAVTQEPLANLAIEEEKPLSMTAKLSASWDGFKRSIANSYRVIPKDQKPKRILPPDATLYVQQNLRMILERAQLALLREQQQIYVQSLTQAQGWIDRHYNVNLPVVQFQEQLESLKQTTIVLTFPDISYSLELLHEYIENLHKLEGVSGSSKSVKAPNSADEGQ